MERLNNDDAEEEEEEFEEEEEDWEESKCLSEVAFRWGFIVDSHNLVSTTIEWKDLTG